MSSPSSLLPASFAFTFTLADEGQPSFIMAENEQSRFLKHFALSDHKASGKLEQLRTSPLVSLSVKDNLQSSSHNPKRVKTTNVFQDYLSSEEEKHEITELFPQYGFMGCVIPPMDDTAGDPYGLDPVLLNTNTPCSAFICGSQGSGKSYTLSCMLENYLHSDSEIGKLPNPLAGVIFHFDKSSDSVCEAAYLCSLGVKVNVLVSQSNEPALRKIYTSIPGAAQNLKVSTLLLQSHDLTVENLLRLMAFTTQEGPVPLYMEVIQRILRQMGTEHSTLDYNVFLNRLNAEELSSGQRSMLDLRLSILESYMDPNISKKKYKGPHKGPGLRDADLFTPTPGTLTIVDLTSIYIDSSTACTLFDICLSLFEQRRPKHGMVVALDEAHKFMDASPSAEAFTSHLLTTIRMQRHTGTRVVIATQEPTLSTKLLDLCSMTFVHRFTSPDWLRTIEAHLAGAATISNRDKKRKMEDDGRGGGKAALMEEIVGLGAGECLLFAPTAVLEMQGGEAKKLGTGYVKFKVRKRLGVDGGESVLALR